MKIFKWFILLVVLVSLFSCTSNPAPVPQTKPVVFVTIPPQAWIVEKIAGDKVDVQVLVKPGQDVHTFSPTPKQLSQLADAKGFFGIGLPIEETLIPKIKSNLKSLQIFDASKNTHTPAEDYAKDDLKVTVEADHDHDHHNGIDRHIWLDPVLVMTIVTNTANGLSELFPDDKPTFTDNAYKVLMELKSLYGNLETELKPIRGKSFLVTHPAYGHFARRFGLHQVALEVHGKEPGPKQLEQIMKKAEEIHATTVFVQPQLSEATAKTLASELKLRIVPLDPLARDIPANLQHIAKALVEALQPKSDTPKE